MNPLRILAKLDPKAFEESASEAQARIYALNAQKIPRSKYRRQRELGRSRTEAFIMVIPLGVWFGLLGFSLLLAFLPIGG